MAAQIGQDDSNMTNVKEESRKRKNNSSHNGDCVEEFVIGDYVSTIGISEKILGKVISIGPFSNNPYPICVEYNEMNQRKEMWVAPQELIKIGYHQN